MQPWAWLIVNGHKSIENRNWPTKFRGPVAIHAGKKMDTYAVADLFAGRHPVTGDRLPLNIDVRDGGLGVGGIVGVAEVVDCTETSDDPWFVGTYGFVLANARPVPFIPVSGALSFFNWRRRL